VAVIDAAALLRVIAVRVGHIGDVLRDGDTAQASDLAEELKHDLMLLVQTIEGDDERSKLSTDLIARVVAFLAEHPNASASAADRALRGRRGDILEAVQLIRGPRRPLIADTSRSCCDGFGTGSHWATCPSCEARLAVRVEEVQK
jgi:hypothetical protein